MKSTNQVAETPSELSLSHIGRWCIAGDPRIHEIPIFRAFQHKIIVENSAIEAQKEIQGVEPGDPISLWKSTEDQQNLQRSTGHPRQGPLEHENFTPLISGLDSSSNVSQSEEASAFFIVTEAEPWKPKGLRSHFGIPKRSFLENSNNFSTPRFRAQICTHEVEIAENTMGSHHPDIFYQVESRESSPLANLQKFLDSW